MSLLKLRSSPFVLIEDYIYQNSIAILQDITSQHEAQHIFVYEQSLESWKKVFNTKQNTYFHEEFDPNCLPKYCSQKCSIVIDSVSQFTLHLGWKKALDCLRLLLKNPNILQVVVVLHKDCISSFSRLQTYLHYLSSAIISFDADDSSTISLTLKKGDKLTKTEEMLCYDRNLKLLSLKPIIRAVQDVKEIEQTLPSNLTTFKIEMEQSEKLQKNNLKLPYMSKIDEGQGKIFYEPDTVDDLDEEDPDDDLDI